MIKEYVLFLFGLSHSMKAQHLMKSLADRLYISIGLSGSKFVLTCICLGPLMKRCCATDRDTRTRFVYLKCFKHSPNSSRSTSRTATLKKVNPLKPGKHLCHLRC